MKCIKLMVLLKKPSNCKDVLFFVDISVFMYAKHV